MRYGVHRLDTLRSATHNIIWVIACKHISYCLRLLFKALELTYLIDKLTKSSEFCVYKVQDVQEGKRRKQRQRRREKYSLGRRGRVGEKKIQVWQQMEERASHYYTRK